MTIASIRFDEVHELDDGGLMGFLLYGEHDVETVEAWLATVGEDYDGDGIFEDAETDGWEVVTTYVRKVPHHDGYGYGQMKYVYSNQPGPGASLVTRVEPAREWSRWCVNHIYERARSGVPVAQVKDPAWPMVLHGGHVYLCGVCSTSFHARMDLARAHALIEMYDARNDEASARYASDQRARLDNLNARVEETNAARAELDKVA